MSSTNTGHASSTEVNVSSRSAPAGSSSGKPFLFLGTRVDDDVADDEYRAMCQYSGIEPARMHRIRVEKGPLPPIDLDSYAGIFLGGGPFNVSDPQETKTALQLRVEADLRRLLDDLVSRDFPFLGCCYGIGTLGGHQGGVIDRSHPEPISVTAVTLTPEGKADRLFGQLPETFDAIVGHKESVASLPPSAVKLASSAACPVQAFRVKNNLYATQFHPESDFQTISVRVDVYANHGYFAPGEGEQVKKALRDVSTPHAALLLQAFARLYG